MVTYAGMPATMLLCLRMASPPPRSASWSGAGKLARSAPPGVPLRVLGISIALALNLILYFLAIRYTGVAVAIFLSYLAPVYLAFVAPRVLNEATDRIVYVALASASRDGRDPCAGPAAGRDEALGRRLFCGWAAGAMYAVYLLFAKSLRTLHVRSTAVVFAQSAFTAVVMLFRASRGERRPLPLQRRDLLMAALLGS